MFERHLIYAIIDFNPEISEHTDDNLQIPACKYGECCYKVDCRFNHFLNPVGRRMVRNVYIQRMKTIKNTEKIKNEIEKYWEWL